jgi:hypothetical protein
MPDNWLDKFEQWKRDGYTPELIYQWYGPQVYGEYSRWYNAPYSGTGSFNYQPVTWSGSSAGMFDPTVPGSTPVAPQAGATYTSPVTSAPGPMPVPSQATAYQGHSGMPTSLGLKPRPKSQPATQQTTQQQQTAGGWDYQNAGATPIAFTNQQWAQLKAPTGSSKYNVYGNPYQYLGADGQMHSSQYNYIGRTMGEANYNNQAAGNDQLNRYGQALGTLGPLNNRRTMTMQFFNGSGTNPDKVYLPPNIRFNTPGGGIPTSHGTGGIKPTKNNNGGGTNQYNDLINWRI